MSRKDVHETTESHDLGPEDAAALEALIDAGYNLDAIPLSLRQRASHIADVLGLIDLPKTPCDQAFLNRTTDLIAASRQRVEISFADSARLCPADEDALDAWVMAGGRMSHVAGSLRTRVAQHDRLADLVSGTASLAAGRSSTALIDATLDLVTQTEVGQRDRMRLGAGRGLRLTDIISVAAIVLLGVSVAFPLFGTMRDRTRLAGCDANLGRVASALGIYAGANNDSLPVMTAGFGGGSWLSVGQDPAKSNSANLYVLVRNRYTELSNLACPGNPIAPTLETRTGAQDWQRIEEVSYSYQVQDGRTVRRFWEIDRALPTIADRSPVVLRIVRGEPIQPEANSPNHGSRGQHLIWTDGSVTWADSPTLDSGDNIWLPRSIEKVVDEAKRFYGMKGNEVPESGQDVLLGP